MSTILSQKRRRCDPELLTLKEELAAAREDLAQAYRQFNEVTDPDLVESCIYQINAVKARCNYLIRAIKERSLPQELPPAAPAAAALAEHSEDAVWS